MRQKEFEVTGLLTSFNRAKNCVSMHGVRLELLEEQVRQIGLPLYPLMMPENADMDKYDRQMK